MSISNAAIGLVFIGIGIAYGYLAYTGPWQWLKQPGCSVDRQSEWVMVALGAMGLIFGVVGGVAVAIR